MTEKKYMCSQCDTEHDNQEEAVFCCQCDHCERLKAMEKGLAENGMRYEAEVCHHAAAQLKACNDLLNRIILMIPGDDLDLVAELSAALGRGAKSCH